MLLHIQDFDYFLAYIRLDELKKYLDITEKYLQKAKADFDAWTDEQVKNLPPGQRQEFYDFYQDDYWQYAEKFPRILRNSFLVSACSLLEFEMDVFCKKLEEGQQIPISWNKLTGDKLERVKNYCKLVKLELSYNGQIWQEINRYYKVRHCIAHTSGLLKKLTDKDKKDLLPYLTEKRIISQDTIEQEIALTKQFCEEVINTMQNFLNEVYTAYEAQKERKNP